jgi:hypothetical protein
LKNCESQRGVRADITIEAIGIWQVAYFCGYRYTPYVIEQGIILAGQRIRAQEQGFYRATRKPSANEILSEMKH